LSAALKGKVQDPGIAVLRGGGNFSKDPLDRGPASSGPMRDPPAQTTAGFEAEAAKLIAGVIDAAPDARPALIANLRDSKGSVNTEALARAAAKLTGDSQQQARDALMQRLTRMSATTLREMLKDDNREIRRAAAAACASKEDKQYIPHLINLLSDSENIVVRAARTSLVALSKQDFGPEPDAGPGDKTKAILAWKNWWKTQMN
jgi:HEAT repeat protein